MNVILAFGLVGTAFMAAIGGMLVIDLLTRAAQPVQRSIFAETAPGAVFLFDGEALVDSTPAARLLLSGSPVRGGDWLRMLSFAAPHFPDIENQLLRLPAEGQITLISSPAHSKPLMLQADNRGGLTRICLADPTNEAQAFIGDPLIHRAMSEELDHLRDAVSRMPLLVWRETAAGEIVWCNTPYLSQAVALLPDGQVLSWPLPRLFERIASAQGASGQRASLKLPLTGTHWFDLSGVPDGDGRLVFATPADTAVHAEGALRDFMQTLTKTFAQLPIGLAIFDRQRQLQLFNPALMDLTGLPPDFLSLRPSLISVLDALRDRNMLPEPKNYRHWRHQLVDMERAAASGLYEETWNLADGQTYRVVGRPHPNGALALMIEDISSEMLRTRRYRADLELGQSVIDEMDEGVAVFSQTGQLVMSNAGYAQLWSHDPAGSLGETSIRGLSAHWRAMSAPGGLWSEVEDFVATVGNRVTWRAETRLLDGRVLSCRIAPLAGGATLIAFRVAEPVDTAQPVLAAKVGRRRA